MTFEELVEVLKGMPGRMVEAEVGFHHGGGEITTFAKFSGGIEMVSQGGANTPTERWNVWWERDGHPKPCGPMISVHGDGYEGAEVKGSGRSLEEVVEDDDDAGANCDAGANWEVVIRQHGFVVTLLVYP